MHKNAKIILYIIHYRLGIFKNFRLERYEYIKHAKHEKLFKSLMSYLLSYCKEIKLKKSFGMN